MSTTEAKDRQATSSSRARGLRRALLAGGSALALLLAAALVYYLTFLYPHDRNATLLARNLAGVAPPSGDVLLATYNRVDRVDSTGQDCDLFASRLYGSRRQPADVVEHYAGLDIPSSEQYLYDKGALLKVAFVAGGTLIRPDLFPLPKLKLRRAYNIDFSLVDSPTVYILYAVYPGVDNTLDYRCWR